MWQVFGEETVMVRAPSVWKEKMVELSKRKKDRERFMKMIEDSEISYYLDIHQVLHVFRIELPTSYRAEDVEFMSAFVRKVIRSSEYPMVALDGEEQKAAMIISAEEEIDEHEERMKGWYEQKKEMDKERK